MLCVVADFWFAASPHHRHIVAFLFFLVSLARLLICLHGLWRLSDTRWGCWIIVPRYVSPCPATKLGPAISQLRSCLFCTCLTYVFASLCMWLAGGRGGCPWNNPDPHCTFAVCSLVIFSVLLVNNARPWLSSFNNFEYSTIQHYLV